MGEPGFWGRSGPGTGEMPTPRASVQAQVPVFHPCSPVITCVTSGYHLETHTSKGGRDAQEVASNATGTGAGAQEVLHKWWWPLMSLLNMVFILESSKILLVG